jgi:hypothetical protein
VARWFEAPRARFLRGDRTSVPGGNILSRGPYRNAREKCSLVAPLESWCMILGTEQDSLDSVYGELDGM